MICQGCGWDDSIDPNHAVNMVKELDVYANKYRLCGRCRCFLEHLIEDKIMGHMPSPPYADVLQALQLRNARETQK